MWAGLDDWETTAVWERDNRVVRVAVRTDTLGNGDSEDWSTRGTSELMKVTKNHGSATLRSVRTQYV